MGTNSVVLNIGDSSLWAPYKDLYNTVNAAVIRKDPDAIPDLEIALKKHKPDFISLLKNPARNSAHREAVMKATTGIAIAGQTGLPKLSQSIVDEALLISDMFDLNELTALELLISGQQQQSHFPGLTRGLVAMLLYYDGRRSLVSALRTIIQSREGRTWTMGLNPELSAILTRFSDQLKEEGLIMKVMDLIESIDITKELDLLHKNRALGGPRYRKQVTDLLGEIKQSLADIIFCWSCQSSLSSEEAIRLLNHLGKSSCLSGDGSLDDVSLTLLMALLYVNDVRYQTYENGNVTATLKKNLGAAASIHKELMSASDTSWQVPGLKSVIQFTWGVGFRTLSQFPNLLEEMNLGENDEDDEKLIDQAIGGGVFQALKKLVIQSALFYDEEFYVKRLHNLVTEFIVLMPLKVKELRNRGDETARIITAHAQEGLEPPVHLPRHFEHLMDMISELYSQDPLNLNLSSDYWCPADSFAEQPFSQRSSQRQVALYKFLRLAGDILPASLFVPYVSMLRSLSKSKISAHHCFSLLKMNGRNAGGQCSIVSWDHFFSTLHRYYNNLRQELALSSDAQYMYRQRLYTKGITPQEVEGLINVLQLIAEVVKQDEVARVTLSENTQYAPVIVLLGLVTCSIAPELKAAVIYSLAAFASSSEVAFNIWQGLEAAQIIPTIKTTSVYHPSGILMELDEVETRNEEYPITRAMLTLLESLLEHPHPVTLGAGQRQPGLDPYVDFIRDSVLLRCSSRAYKEESEKWKIITLCLRILEKVLHNYRIKQEDFTKVFSSSMDNSAYRGFTGPHPGYSILAQMLQDSGLLRMVLLILDEGTKIIDLYASVAGQSHIEESALLALRLLHETLLRQDAFLEQVRDGGCNILVTSLDNLLMSVNPRSGQTDHLFVISKYIMYNTDIPEHSLYSMRIHRSLCASALIAKHLVGVFDIDSNESEMLLNGFVECLEVDVAGEDDPDGDTEQTTLSIRNKARQQLLLLLLGCLKLPGPNLAHYLLGFNIHKSLSQTVLQEPGIMGSPRTCLHAILSLLDTGTVTGGYPSNVYNSPYATELAYQLIYTLCTDRDTSRPTLRYLRSTHDFLFRHLQYLPFKPKGEYNIKNLSQQSWLLRTLAVELRVTSADHQRSQVQRLLSALLDDKPSTESGGLDTTIEPVPGMSRTTSYSFIKSTTGPFRRRLMQILDSLDFKQVFPELPVWEYFDSSEVERLLKECEVQQVEGPVLISIEEVHRRLNEETAALQNISGLGQRTHMSQEISSVLQFAVNHNKAREAIFVKRQAFESWRQVTEVVLIACPLDVLGCDRKHQMVLEVSQELIRRIMDEDILPELMPPASGVILTLMTTLHHSVLSSMQQSLPQSLPTTEEDSVGQIPPKIPVIHLAHHSSLLIVLKTIVECLLKTGSGLQRVRANYYGAFLNLLCIVQKPFDMQTYQRSAVETAIFDEETENKKLRTEFMDTILCFGETIMEIVCRDACGGHDISKMLSLAVLDVAISLDTHNQWLHFLVSKGYLRHLLDSLIKDNQELQKLLDGNSSSYRILYVFESKIALLARIGSSVDGALDLLRNGIMVKLAECRSLDLRPDTYRLEELRDESMWIFPDLMKSYQQILTSVLKLVLSITMTLGSVHQEATVQLLSFISGHVELFCSILRDHSIMNSLSGLEELSLVTAVLSRAALNNHVNLTDGTLFMNQREHFLLFRHHLLALLPNLVASDSSALFQKSSMAVQMKVVKLQIVAHILNSCCAAVNHSSVDLGNFQVLFSPSLADISAPEPYHMGRNDVRHRPINRNRSPELSLLVTLLDQCCSQLQASMDERKLLLQRLQSLPTLTSEQLAEYLPGGAKTEQQSTVHMQRGLARESLTKLLHHQSRETAILSYIIECSAFILLRHLEYFIIHCKKDTMPLPQLQQPGHFIRRLQDATMSLPDVEQLELFSSREPSISQQDLDSLKADIPSVIGDNFFRKLHSVKQYLSKGRSHVSFVEAITHRIKRLVKLRVK